MEMAMFFLVIASIGLFMQGIKIIEKNDDDRSYLLQDQIRSGSWNDVVKQVQSSTTSVDSPTSEPAAETPAASEQIKVSVASAEQEATAHHIESSNPLDLLQRAMDRAATEGRSPAGLCAYKMADRITFLGLEPAKKRRVRKSKVKTVLPASVTHPIEPTLPSSGSPDQEDDGSDLAPA